MLLLAGALALPALGDARLYDTSAEIQDYAHSVSGGALYAINGKFHGINTLGGIIQDEFGFIASFLFPVAGLVLMTRATRGEEEEGRLDLLLARPLDRRAPVVGATVVTGGAILAATALIGICLKLAASDLPVWRDLLYAMSLGALVYMFAGVAGVAGVAAVAAVAAQLVRHARDVYAIGFAVLFMSYLVRGLGDAGSLWFTRLSPLGWTENVDAFGRTRWWVLSIPVAVGVVAAVVLANRRDLGASTLQYRVDGPEGAGSLLRCPVGTALYAHRPTILGWTFAAVAFMGMFGGLAREVVDAIVGNSSLADALDTSAANAADGSSSVAPIPGAGRDRLPGHGVQCGSTRGGDWQDRTDHGPGSVAVTMARPADRRRYRWHARRVAGGNDHLRAGRSDALSDAGLITRLVGSGFAYVPVYLIVAGLACALLAVRPRLYSLMWGVVAAIVSIAFLGPGLSLPMAVRDLAPTQHVGSPPAGDIHTLGLFLLAPLGWLLGVTSFIAFRLRDILQS